MVSVKICGLTCESDVRSAIAAGADRVGFVLIPTSPRHIGFEAAQALIRLAAELGAEPWVVASATVAGLDGFISQTPEIGAVQLHGRESPAEVAALVKRHPLVPVVKAIGVSSKRDLNLAGNFKAADAFLFDAKPPKGAAREGGHGISFDWSILKGFRVADHEDWTLSGGLTPQNVAEAVRMSGAHAVDVSSGVEASPGVKDPAKVKAFVKAAKALL